MLRLDGTWAKHDEGQAVRQLRQLGPAFADWLLVLFQKSKRLQPRCSAVFYATPCARVSKAAIQIGTLAVFDKSMKVRFRGCELLAYSLRPDVVRTLQHARKVAPPAEWPDFDAALDAIAHQNHHYFYDRDHSGKFTWDVQSVDG